MINSTLCLFCFTTGPFMQLSFSVACFAKNVHKYCTQNENNRRIKPNHVHSIYF